MPPVGQVACGAGGESGSEFGSQQGEQTATGHPGHCRCSLVSDQADGPRFAYRFAVAGIARVITAAGGAGSSRRWAQVVEDRIEALRVQIEQMEAAMAGRRGLPAQITPGKAPGEAAVTWALTTGRHNSESQAMRPAAGSQCGVRRSIRGEEWK